MLQANLDCLESVKRIHPQGLCGIFPRNYTVILRSLCLQVSCVLKKDYSVDFKSARILVSYPVAWKITFNGVIKLITTISYPPITWTPTSYYKGVPHSSPSAGLI